VEISDILENPESWGAYLADIGRVISGALAEHPNNKMMSQEEALAEIQKGFNSGASFLPQSVVKTRSAKAELN
jgi:hypothetical protein